MMRIKAFLQQGPGGSGQAEIRRFQLTSLPEDNRGVYSLLITQVTSIFPGLADLVGDLQVTWKDSDGDHVIMTSDEELLDALSESKNNQLSIYITVNNDTRTKKTTDTSYEPFTILNQQGNKDDDIEITMEDLGSGQQQLPNTNNPSVAENENAHVDGRKETWPWSEIPFPPSSMPMPPPPPPHPFGWSFMFGPPGPWARGGRHGLHGGPMRKRWHHFHGKPGHEPSHWSPFVRKQNHGNNPWSHWVCPAFGGGGFGPMPGHRHAPSDTCHEEKRQSCSRAHGSISGQEEKSGDSGQAFGPSAGQDKCSEFKSFIKEVPFKHRRWAKGYIKQWYQDHHKQDAGSSNGQGAVVADMDSTPATEAADGTGADDNEAGQRVSLEEAGVTQAYATWLNSVLPKVLKADQSLSEIVMADLIDHRISVPLTFQKWCLWYLKWKFTSGCKPRVNFANQSSPGNKKCQENCADSCMKWKKHSKNSRKDVKANIPLKYRMWAKGYINQWRHDHMIDSDAVGKIVLSSSSECESEDPDKTLPEMVDIPDAYRKWMEKFLTRWHTIRGMAVQNETISTTPLDGKFKDDVPIKFRKWVRCFVNRHANRERGEKGKLYSHHHGHKNPHCHGSKKQRKIMRNLYSKWHQNAGSGAWVTVESSSSSSSSSSDSSSSSSDEDVDDMQMATSMKRLRLDPSGSKKLAEATNGQEDAMQPPQDQSDSEGPAGDDPLWAQWRMMKMMAKMHKKQMKLARKAAKKEAKAAWRANKFYKF